MRCSQLALGFPNLHGYFNLIMLLGNILILIVLLESFEEMFKIVAAYY